MTNASVKKRPGFPLVYRLIVLYILFGLIWLFLSEVAMVAFEGSPKQLISIHIYKDIFFVVFSTFLLCFFSRLEIKARRQAEELLHASEKHYRLLFKSNPMPLWVYDLETLAFLEVNDAAIQKYGYSREEFLSMTIKDIRPPEDIPRLLDNVSKVTEGLDEAGVWRHRKKNGDIIDVEITSHTLISNGRRTELVLANDITERKRAEQALREKEHFLSESQRIARIGSWNYDLAGRITWTDETYRIYGVSPDTFNLNTESFINLIHPDDQPAMQLWINACIAGEKPRELEFRIILPDSSIRWLSGRGELKYDADNRPAYMAGSVQDITERKAFETAIMQGKEEWEKTFDAVPDLIAIIDNKHRIVRLNRAMAARLGREPRDCIGLKCYEQVHGTTEPPSDCPHAQLLQDGKGHHAEVYEERLGGTFLITTSPVFSKSGLLEGSVHVARDITEQKRLEEQKDRIERQMLRLEQMELIGKIAAGVAHEVRNPLHAILSLTEALQKKLGDSDEYTLFLSHMKSQVDHLSAVMRDLLDLGKPIEPANLYRIPLYDICALSLDLWNDSPLSTAHPVRLMAPVDETPAVIADSQKMQQVFFNLFENAALNSPQGSEIQITFSHHDEGSVTVSVMDQGSGISETVLPRVFEPFFTTRKKGTGLGLSIVKSIIENHGGTITIKNNTPLPGCTAEITLPVTG